MKSCLSLQAETIFRPIAARIFQIVVGLVLFFCSTAAGMANNCHSEEVWADFFDANAVDDDENSAVLAFDNTALLPNLAEVESSETSVESEEELKRNQQRTSSHHKFLSKCRINQAFSAKRASKGIARHPLTQDAQQERTAAIRFLQVCSLDC